MANKNQKRIRNATRKAGKAGNGEYAVEVPSGGYHNYDKGVYVTRRVTTARTNGDGVNSASPRRNMQQRVLSNSGGGAGSSLTSHEPINRSHPVRHKNHSYMTGQYKQPAGAR